MGAGSAAAQRRRGTYVWGVEGRVPFLDKEFMDVAMRINPQDKMINGERMEKWVVRKAFEDMIPESVAWRQKNNLAMVSGTVGLIR